MFELENISTFQTALLNSPYKLLVSHAGNISWFNIKKNERKKIEGIPLAVYQKPRQSNIGSIVSLLNRIEQHEGKRRSRNLLVCDFINPALYIQEYSKFWIPSLVNWSTENKQAVFESDIANLNHYHFPDAKLHLAKILSKFCLMWGEGLGIKLQSQLQVIVKAQTYNLEKNDVYEGQLHREGPVEENILAVGIWYYELDRIIKGGELQLVLNTNKYTAVSVENNSLIAFRNDYLYHRVTKMERRETKNPQKYATRKILCFFLIDPHHPQTLHIDKVPQLNQRFLVADILTSLSLLPLVLVRIINDYLQSEEAALLAQHKWSTFRRKRGIVVLDENLDNSDSQAGNFVFCRNLPIGERD